MLAGLKASDAEFPQGAIRRAGYGAICRGQKTWNGVAILARGVEPVVTRTELPGDRSDTQSRYIEAAVKGIVIGCLYLPNGNPQPGPKFAPAVEKPPAAGERAFQPLDEPGRAIRVIGEPRPRGLRLLGGIVR